MTLDEHEHEWERCDTCDDGSRLCTSCPVPFPHEYGSVLPTGGPGRARTLFVPYAMTAAGVLMVLLAVLPLSESDWLPRWALWLAGCWTAVVGIGLSVMLTEEEE